MALLEKAAGQGHAYAMFELAAIFHARKEYGPAAEWWTQGAEAGLPKAMFCLASLLDKGEGVAEPDPAAAAVWYRRAAGAGLGGAANNLSKMYTLGRGWAWQILPATLQTNVAGVKWRHMKWREHPNTQVTLCLPRHPPHVSPSVL
jgi:TPR repeat protein